MNVIHKLQQDEETALDALASLRKKTALKLPSRKTPW